MTGTILVTGAAGFIGSAVVTSLSASGHKVVALDGLLDGLYPSAEKIDRLESSPRCPESPRFTLTFAMTISRSSRTL